MSGFKTSKKQSVQPQSQPQYEVADVLNILGSKLENLELNSWQLRTLFALKKCRTSALGGHVDACDECGNISISYNSCRNRHCPKCQENALRTIAEAKRIEELLVGKDRSSDDGYTYNSDE